MEAIEINYENLIEFEIEEPISFVYNLDNSDWILYEIDTEDGEEYESIVKEDRVMEIVGQDEFNKFKEIILEHKE